jgi:hypothetical protein
MVALCALCPPSTPCVIAGTERMHTHYVTTDMLPDVKSHFPVTAKHLKVGDTVCCKHFVAGHPQRFRT